MGAQMAEGARISKGTTFIGDISIISLGEHAEINAGCFIVAKAPIIIGAHSTLAYHKYLFLRLHILMDHIMLYLTFILKSESL